MKKHEEILQTACILYFRLQYPDKMIYAIPNGGSRNVIEASNLKRAGVLSGVADCHIPIPNKQYHSLFIEFKYGQKTKQTDNQIYFQKKVETWGNRYEVCRSFDEFRQIIDNYFNQ
jgi:hypothetical protein